MSVKAIKCHLKSGMNEGVGLQTNTARSRDQRRLSDCLHFKAISEELAAELSCADPVIDIARLSDLQRCESRINLFPLG